MNSLIESEKRTHYIEKSLKLFLKQGVKYVTMADVAKQLNVSTKTIYKIFEDKTDLLKACLQIDQSIIENTYQRILQIENPLEASIEFYHELSKRLSSVHPNYFDEIKRHFPEIWQQTVDSSLGHIQNILQKGVDSGVFYSKIDTQLTAETIALLIRSIVDEDLRTTTIQDRQKLAFNIIYPYLRGICTSKGLEEIKIYFQNSELY